MLTFFNGKYRLFWPSGTPLRGRRNTVFQFPEIEVSCSNRRRLPLNKYYTVVRPFEGTRFQLTILSPPPLKNSN